MRFSQIDKRLVIVYPGRFQPFHLGHKQVFDFLVKQFGAGSVYIATSDKVEPLKSPFSFAEKKALMQLTGVPSSQVILTKNPYQAQEITANYDPTKNVLVFAVSEKDMSDDPRFKFGLKKDGTPSYLQAFQKDHDFKTFDKHGYVYTVPTFDFSILGREIQSASEIRAMYKDSDSETRVKLFTELFGKFDQQLFKMVDSKLGDGNGG